MSMVTNIIITTWLDEPGITQLNELIGSQMDKREVFKEVSGHAGGIKAIEAEIWVSAFNYLNLDAFTKLLNQVRWERPESVLVLVNEQEDECFRRLQC